MSRRSGAVCEKWPVRRSGLATGSEKIEIGGLS